MRQSASLDEFRHSLAATVAWCTKPSRPPALSARLRTPNLQPPIHIVRETNSLNRVHAAVQHVVDCRSKQIVVDHSAVALSGGRLLAFFPQHTISDGFAAEESDEFFDRDNVPPWDTWVYFVDDFVISFVPSQFLTNAEFGLLTNVEECIIWLSNVDHPFVDMLEAENLVA